MPLPKEEIYTIDDIYALPEGERAELIDGHIYYMAPPSRTHQKISMELSSLIREYIRTNKGKCEVYPMRRKTPCFSYGDIRHVHRIYASN